MPLGLGQNPPQITALVPAQAPVLTQAQRVAMANAALGLTPPNSASGPIGGAPISSQELAQMLQQQPPSIPTSSGGGSPIGLGEAMMIAKQQQNANNPETPGQTFNSMLQAGATPQQAMQVAGAPSGATGDYSAGYVQPDSNSGLLGLLASIFSSGGGAGAAAGAGGQ